MSNRKRIKVEEKIRIAKACAQGTKSLNAAAEQLGIHQSVVDDWVRLYETEGVESFLPRKGNRRYAPALKETAVMDYLSGGGRQSHIYLAIKECKEEYGYADRPEPPRRFLCYERKSGTD